MNFDEEKIKEEINRLEKNIGKEGLENLLDSFLNVAIASGDKKAILIAKGRELGEINKKVKEIIIDKGKTQYAEKAINLYEQIIKLLKDFFNEMEK